MMPRVKTRADRFELDQMLSKLLNEATFRQEVVVFAHNEARFIAACVDSIKRTRTDDLVVTVLINGCDDATPDIVAALCRENPWLRMVELSVGDKANAWNVFVHELADPASDVVYFLDGDGRVEGDALSLLAAELAGDPHALVASAVPAKQWMSTGAYRRQLLSEGGVSGNLYAVRGSFVRRLRDLEVRMPLGWIGDDGLVGLLASTNLDPQGVWDARRIRVCAQARFHYEPVLKMLWRNPAAYWRRKLRYSLRHFQNGLLGERLVRTGLAGMPADAATLYREEDTRGLSVRWNLRQLWFDWRALALIRTAHDQSRA